MKHLILLFAFMSVCEILFSQSNFTMVSSTHDYPALKGDQVITRVYKDNQTLTHYRHIENEYIHSFIIHKGGQLNAYTKRMQFNLNEGVEPDEPFRKLTVNDMRIEDDYCYFCGKLTLIGPVMYDINNNPIWLESDIGIVGFFSIPDLIAGNVTLQYRTYYTTSEFTRLTTWSYMYGQSPCLMVAAIGRLYSQPNPCVLELRNINNIWTESLGYINSTDEVFSDILYNTGNLIVASYHQCNGDEGNYQYEPNHWKFIFHRAPSSGFCDNYGEESAAEYDTYGLTTSIGTTGWHNSNVQLRLCKLKNGRTCMAYGAMKSSGHPNVLLFSMLNPLDMIDTIMALHTDVGYSIVHDMVGLLGGGNTVAVLTSCMDVEVGRLHFPMISTTATTFPQIDIYGYMKRSVDKWDSYSAITGGYNATEKVIWGFYQNRTSLYPTNPAISCFICGYSNCEAIGGLEAEKISYEWNKEFHNHILLWNNKDCIFTSEVSEDICTKYRIITQ